ncbi:substrate-binding domain-containing protein [Paludibacterium yongneupense]|uniref:substrate-binding domain-containing protein n=1 Tax=Paludibacterium yongneupense TaxID=400061 RepID=UPI00055A15D4|nr:substrate-binding domain-containing protein [Paludibacterium yongneupense]
MDRRRFIQFCLACAMAGFVLTTAAASPPLIGLVLKSVGSPYFIEMAAGARNYQRAHHNDFTLKIDGVVSEMDSRGQEAIIGRLIARHAAALLVTPADSSDLLPVLARAIASGILVISIDNKIDDRAQVRFRVNIPFVGPSNFNAARSVGKALLPQLRPGDQAAIIEGLRGSINARARSDGFGEALRGGGIEVAGIRRGDWQSDGGYRAASQLLDTLPHLRALLCGNDNMAIGASRAIAERKLKGKVLVAGYDGIPEVHPLIADGTLFASANQYPARQAEYALQLALSALASHARQADLPAIVQTPVMLMTRKP